MNYLSQYTHDEIPLDDDFAIRDSMQQRINMHLNAQANWRNREVRENFAMFDGDQWAPDDLARQRANGMPAVTINRTKPTINAICGFQVQNRKQVKYIPQLLDNTKQSGFSDMMDMAVKHMQEKMDSAIQESLAFRDMLICGIGCTDTYWDYSQPPYAGSFHVKRIFPGFVFWDISAREKNLLDANWVVNIKVVPSELIKQEYNIDTHSTLYSQGLDARILEFFNSVLAIEDLGVIYEYQWREKAECYLVQNPFRNLDMQELIAKTGVNTYEGVQSLAMMVQDLMKYYGEKFSFRPELDQVFGIEDPKDYRGFKEAIDFLGLKVKKTTQHRFKYYRAIIVADQVVSKAENWAQDGFSIKFMTGEFSENTQAYYGLVSSCRDPQRMLNQVVSDYQGFLNTIPKGGVNIEEDAVADVSAFLDTYARASYVTVFRSGALAGGKVQPKLANPLPQGMLEMIQYADSQIMQVCGVTAELMGMMQTKEQNAGFLKQQIRQCLTTLATYFDAMSSYQKEQGKLYIDCVRILAENMEGVLIKDLTGDHNGQYVPLLKDDLAEQYEVIVEDMPSTPAEKEETFFKLLDMQAQLANKQNPVDIMPIILEYAPFQQSIVAKLKEAIQPPAPPEPDPINIALLQSETNYKNASAEKLMADVYRMRVEALEKEKALEYADAKYASDIVYTEAKASESMAKAGSVAEETAAKRIENVFQRYVGSQMRL